MNLIVRNVAIEGKQYVGSIAGYSKWGTLQCCVNEGGTVSGENYVGGLVGEGSGKIYNCYNKCTVSATGDNVGGILGSLGGVIWKESQTMPLLPAEIVSEELPAKRHRCHLIGLLIPSAMEEVLPSPAMTRWAAL